MKKTLIAAALTLACSTASAIPLTQTFSFNAPPPAPESTTEIDIDFNLGLFDTNLGILNSVVLSLFANATSSATFTNRAANPQSFRSDGSVDVFFTTSLAVALTNPLVSLTLPYTGGGFVEIPATGTFTATDVQDSDLLVNNFAAGDFGAFSAAGGGNFGLNCESFSGIGITGGGGNIDAAQTTTAGCGAEVVYTYTERETQVPEPGSLALLGLGLAGLAAVRRRRQGLGAD